MGRSYTYPTEKQLAAERMELEQIAKSERMKVAHKIVMVIIDQIINEIVRPGPKPEERECYVMAEELRSISEALATQVEKVLKVEEEEG